MRRKAMYKLLLILISVFLAGGCVAGGSAQGYAGPPVVHVHSHGYAGATLVVSTQDVRFQDYSEIRRQREAERLARSRFYAEHHRRMQQRRQPAYPHVREPGPPRRGPQFSCQGVFRHGRCSSHRADPPSRHQPSHPHRPPHLRPKPRHDQHCRPDSRTHRRPPGCRP